MNFTERFRMARETKMISLHTISEKTGISLDMLEKWDSGKEFPGDKQMEAISSVLDVSAEFLKNDAADYTVSRIALSKLMAIKGFLIFGLILETVDIVLVLIPFFGVKCFYGLFSLLVLIPFYLWVCHEVENSSGKDDLIPVGILSIFFLSLIGGIYILCIKKNAYCGYGMDEVLARSHYSEPKPIPGVVRDALYAMEGKRRSVRRNFFLNQEKKSELLKKIDEIEPEALTLNSPSEYDSFIVKHKDLLKPYRKKFVRFGYIVSAICIGIIMIFLTIRVIVPETKKVAQKREEEVAAAARREEEYQELMELIQDENYYTNARIETLIRDLSPYYDVSEASLLWDYRYRYARLVEYMEIYAPFYNDRIENLLYGFPEDFPRISDIKEQYIRIRDISAIIQKDTTSMGVVTWDDMTAEKAEEIRKCVRALYEVLPEKYNYWRFAFLEGNNLGCVAYGAKLLYDDNTQYIIFKEKSGGICSCEWNFEEGMDESCSYYSQMNGITFKIYKEDSLGNSYDVAYITGSSYIHTLDTFRITLTINDVDYQFSIVEE